MSFLNNIIKRKAKEAPPTGIVAYMMQNPVWSQTDLKNLAVVGYENCQTVFACIQKITRAAGGIPWTLMKPAQSSSSKSEQIEKHPLLDLMARPNPSQGQSRFIEGVTGFYYIAGNSYILNVGPERGAPQELHWLYPHVVEIIPGNNAEPVSKYIYKADPTKPTPYEPNDVLHLKSFHPTDFWYGLSPLKVAAKSIDTLNMATHWNMKLLQNDMRPPGALKIEGRLTEAQREDLRTEINANWIGHESIGKPLILEGGQEWMPFSINPRDSDWLNSQKLTVRFVCLALGIPPELMGDAENKTYSNQKEARRALYEETILPYMDFLTDEFNNDLTPRFGDGLKLGYDKDSIEALREDRASVFDRAQSSQFLTVNEKRTMTGFEEIGGGDVILSPISMVPIGSSMIDKDEDIKSLRFKSKPNNKSFWNVPEKKEALWNNFVLLIKAKGKSYEKIAHEYMKDQKKRIEKNMSGEGAVSGISPQHIIYKDDEAKAYREKFMPWYFDSLEKAGQAGLSSTKGELFSLEEKQGTFDFEVTPGLESVLQEMVFNSGTQVNQTLIDMIYRSHQRALKESWTVEQLTQSILHQIDDFAPWRARLWARTEAVKVENWGQLEGYKQTEFVELKGWLSAFAPLTRESHMAADSDYADNPIPLNEAFMVDGESLQYPGDPAGSPGNVCNCLCSTYPEVLEIGG